MYTPCYNIGVTKGRMSRRTYDDGMRGNVKTGKREWILIGIAAICLLAGSYFYKSIGKEQELIKYNASFLELFDTKTEIVGYGTSEAAFKKQVETLKEKLTFYHQLYDIYHNYEGMNNIKTINDNAGIEPVVVDREIIELLKMSKELYEVTDGKVNVAMGSVLSIWHDYRDAGLADPVNARIPSMEELEEAANYMDIDQLIIDEEASTVYLTQPEMSIDVGGIGKGYAVQKLAEYARELGMENLLISVGGNICAVGGKIDGSSWKVGILNPDLDSEEPYVEMVAIEDVCVVTSGDYQRYYVVEDTEYCHIIDPDTLMPSRHFPSVSILAKDSGMADAISTAVYNMSLEDGMAFINGMDAVEAMWVMEDGTIYYSDNFEQYLNNEENES